MTLTRSPLPFPILPCLEATIPQLPAGADELKWSFNGKANRLQLRAYGLVCRMKPRRFDLFANMLDHVPVKAILAAIKLEHWMIEDDMLYKRVPETKDVNSILYFCQFIIAVIEGETILPRRSLARHVAFYREIVLRLIKTGQLPDESIEQFDHAYSQDTHSLAC
jgi:hypothetical protein